MIGVLFIRGAQIRQFTALGITLCTHLLKSFDVGTAREFPRHKSLDMIIVYDDEVNLAEKKDEVFACFETVRVS